MSGLNNFVGKPRPFGNSGLYQYSGLAYKIAQGVSDEGELVLLYNITTAAS